MIRIRTTIAVLALLLLGGTAAAVTPADAGSRTADWGWGTVECGGYSWLDRVTCTATIADTDRDGAYVYLYYRQDNSSRWRYATRTRGTYGYWSKTFPAGVKPHYYFRLSQGPLSGDGDERWIYEMWQWFD